MLLSCRRCSHHDQRRCARGHVLVADRTCASVLEVVGYCQDFSPAASATDGKSDEGDIIPP